MKNTILTLLVCALSTCFANAQIAKGDLFWGASVGSTSYSSATSNFSYIDGNGRLTNSKNYGLVLNPMLGVFVTDHLIVGGLLGLNYSHNNTNSSATEGGVSTSVSTTNNFTIDAGPFLRYYFFDRLPARNLLYLQGQGTIGAGSGNSSGSGSNINSTYTSSGTVKGIFTYTGGASIGVTHFIGRDHGLGLDVSLGYLYSHLKSTNADDTYRTITSTGNKTTAASNYDLATHTNGVTLSVGFHWFINAKNKG